MRSRSAGALRDIAENLKLAQEFVAGMDWETFRQDRRTVYSVVRCFEIVSEASRRLGEEIKARHPHLAWRALAAAGNIYRHEYERVAEVFVWSALQNDVEALLAAVEAELARPENQ